MADLQTGRGDCLRACVASILELPIEAVPLVTNIAAFYPWLKARGKMFSRLVLHGQLHVAGVPSLNALGRWHVVVAQDGFVMWDPSPYVKRVGRIPDRGRYAIWDHP
jgi:hypothetical protein